MSSDLDAIRALAQQILDRCGPAAAPVIRTPEDLDRAVSTSPSGSTLVLGTDLVYQASFVLPKPFVLQSESWAARQGFQMEADEPAPRFLGGLSAFGDGHQIRGLELRHPDQTRTIGVMGGAGAVWDRMRILGDPTLGAKRGIDFRGGTGAIIDCLIDDIFQPAQDTQAIYSQEMLPGGGLTILNGFLRAAGEVVMFGGGDSTAPETMPSNVILNDCILDKKPEWLDLLTATKHRQQVKCSLELKAISGFSSARCTFRRGGGISQGQGGYAFDLTVRNQDGKAPWSCVHDVLIEDFTIEQPGSGVASISGFDSNFPSGTLKNLTLRRGLVVGVDHNALSATKTTGRLFTFDHAPDQVTLQDIAVAGFNIRSICYFQGLQPPTGLTITNLLVDNGGLAIPYPFKLDGNTHPVGVAWPTNTRAALAAYMPDGVFDGSVQ